MIAVLEAGTLLHEQRKELIRGSFNQDFVKFIGRSLHSKTRNDYWPEESGPSKENVAKRADDAVKRYFRPKYLDIRLRMSGEMPGIIQALLDSLTEANNLSLKISSDHRKGPGVLLLKALIFSLLNIEERPLADLLPVLTRFYNPT